MVYHNVTEGIFLNRPNRFIAHVLINNHVEICHVKNTGRCQELLLPDTRVFLEWHPNAKKSGRKTEYSLIGVYKQTAYGETAVNMDSQAPNQLAYEWLLNGDSPFGAVSSLKREVTFRNSRFDIAFTDSKGIPSFMEVKGVTLEKQGLALFPDAPTQRGVKHLKELSEALSAGFQTYVLFVIQMKGVHTFQPNFKTHPEFGTALKQAADKGVHILAYDCVVSDCSLEIDSPVAITL